MHERLADKHPIKRVFMNARQSFERKSGFLMERKEGNFMSGALIRDILCGRHWQGEPPERIFDGNFPGGNGTQIHLVFYVSKGVSCRIREGGLIRDQPQERTGI